MWCCCGYIYMNLSMWMCYLLPPSVAGCVTSRDVCVLSCLLIGDVVGVIPTLAYTGLTWDLGNLCQRQTLWEMLRLRTCRRGTRRDHFGTKLPRKTMTTRWDCLFDVTLMRCHRKCIVPLVFSSEAYRKCMCWLSIFDVSYWFDFHWSSIWWQSFRIHFVFYWSRKLLASVWLTRGGASHWSLSLSAEGGPLFVCYFLFYIFNGDGGGR